MRVAIMGTRGIPNRYGGFEQATQFLSKGLVAKGHEVFVYNPCQHPFREEKWEGVNIIRCRNPEDRLGAAGLFFYDLNCINDARRKNFDVLLHLGYTSDSIWHKRWPKQSVHLVNMDGMEWKRPKYSRVTRRFLKYAEKLAAKNGDALIADSLAVKAELFSRYGKNASYIPYGATVFENPDPSCLEIFSIRPNAYSLLIARIEPENNIELVIRGWLATEPVTPLLIVGDTSNKYGRALRKKYDHPLLKFPGTVFEHIILNNLRYFSSIYFHGHSVGGTNPSLLEAMACHCRIAAHDNEFNRAVLENDAFYFTSSADLESIIRAGYNEKQNSEMKAANIGKIRSRYNWEKITGDYEALMLTALSARR